MHDSTARHRWRRERRGRKNGAAGGRTHVRAIEGPCIPYNTRRASVYRSEARANQTDIIDLTCDLEIRKITDGERLEPIIIVNIGRPSPLLLTAAIVALSFSLGQLYIPLVPATVRPATSAFASSLPPLLLFFGPSLPICVFLSSRHPSPPIRARALPPVFSCHLRVSPAGVRAGRSLSRAFIYINFAGFLLFGGFGAPL